MVWFYTLVIVNYVLLVNLWSSLHKPAEVIKAEIFPCKRPESQESRHWHLKNFHVPHERSCVYPF